MARRTVTTARRQKAQEKPKYQCRHCGHSYDWHERDWKGEPFLCRCPYYKGGRFSRFLTDPQCEHFLIREEAGDGNG